MKSRGLPVWGVWTQLSGLLALWLGARHLVLNFPMANAYIFINFKVSSLKVKLSMRSQGFHEGDTAAKEAQKDSLLAKRSHTGKPRMRE